MAKLTQEIANDIREQHSNGKSLKELFILYNTYVSSETPIRNIISNKAWIVAVDPVELECADCGNKFAITTEQRHAATWCIKYCSPKCRKNANMKAYRARKKTTLLPKKCAFCNDEFVPTVKRKKFCCQDCLRMWEAANPRLYQMRIKHNQLWKKMQRTVFNSKAMRQYGACNLIKPVFAAIYFPSVSHESIDIDFYTDRICNSRCSIPGCKHSHRLVYKECNIDGCKRQCKCIKRIFDDGSCEIVSYQKGWFVDGELLLCILCKEKLDRDCLKENEDSEDKITTSNSFTRSNDVSYNLSI